MTGWVAMFGAPSILISDQGRQFESHKFKQMLQYLGTKRQRTTAYHPQSNGMCERFHRTLKAALRATQPAQWCDALPIILLTLRATAKEDIGHSPAELVFGEEPRLPNQFQEAPTDEPTLAFLPALQRLITNQNPVPVREQPARRAQVPDSLKAAPFLLLRRDAHTTPLQEKYSGPYKVMERTDKHVTLQLQSGPTVVSWERVKEAVIPDNPVTQPDPVPTPEPAPVTHPQAPPQTTLGQTLTMPEAPPRAAQVPIRTSSGRVSRKPDRYQPTIQCISEYHGL